MRKSLPSFVMGAVGAAFLTAALVASASRNAAGTMSLYTPGNPVVSGTSISTSWANNTLSDLSTEMTDSLSRSGKGGMLAALRGIDGTVASPAYSFTNDTGGGWYRIGASDFGFALAGVKKLELASALWTVVPAASFSSTANVVGDFSVNTNKFNVTAASGNTTLAGTLASSVSGSGTTALGSLLEPSLANGSAAQFFVGAAQSANASLGLAFTPNATAALSTACFGVFGQNSVCSNGNNLTTTGSLQVGASGTAISASFRGTAVVVGAPTTSVTSVAIAAITVTGATAGADCIPVYPSGVTPGGRDVLACAVTTNTCTLFDINPSAGAGAYASGTYACRVFNP